MSGAMRSMTGAFTGTGASLDIHTVGFKPRYVKLFNETGLAIAEWTDSMDAGSMLKQVTAGTISKSANGITPLDDGFTLGADTDMNVAAELVHYIAHE